MNQAIDSNNETITHILGNKLSENSTVFMNVDTDYIMISEDKLINILEKHQRQWVDWVAPLGVFATLVMTLFFCDPKAIWGLSAEDIHSVVVATSAICFIWLLIAVYRAVKYRGSNSPSTILREIKKNMKESNKK